MDNILNSTFSFVIFPFAAYRYLSPCSCYNGIVLFMVITFFYVSNVMCSPNNLITLENSQWVYCSPAKHPTFFTCSTVQSSFISLNHCCNVLLLTLFVIKYYVFCLSSYILHSSPTALLPLSPDPTVQVVGNFKPRFFQDQKLSFQKNRIN